MTITLAAPAKINLALHVTSRRDDGYHLLDSIVTFTTRLADIVTIRPATEQTLTFSGPFSGRLVHTDLNSNLIIRAVRLFQNHTADQSKYAIHLEKNIPIGAGLGGGSADAAATLKGLEQLSGKTIPHDQRILGLSSLGADIPVCDYGRAVRFQGIGDVLCPAPLFPALPCVLVWPGVGCATQDVFKNLGENFQKSLTPAQEYTAIKPFYRYLHTVQNGLEAPARAVCPRINEAILALEDHAPSLTRMTGSGSCVIGYFETEQQATTCALDLEQTHPDWWIKSDLTQPSGDQTTP